MNDHILNDSGMTELLLAAYHGELDWVQNCINAGSDVHARCNSGMTPLHWVVDMGIVGECSEREAIVTLLIVSKADINAVDNTSESIVARSVAAGNAKLTQLLVKAGADVNKADNKGVKPLNIANNNDDVMHIELLLNAGAKP